MLFHYNLFCGFRACFYCSEVQVMVDHFLLCHDSIRERSVCHLRTIALRTSEIELTSYLLCLNVYVLPSSRTPCRLDPSHDPKIPTNVDVRTFDKLR
jgi:hypothetical protein